MNVAVVGCGTIACYHLPHILRNKNVKTVAIADRDRARAEAMAQRFRVNHIYTDYAAMLAEQRPDVVHVLTPPPTHAALAIQAMEAGAHVLVEKPMALTVAEADAMVEAAHGNGVKLCVDHNNLWEPLMVKARDLVDQGRVGTLLHLDVHYAFDYGRVQKGRDKAASREQWLMSLPGGLLFDLVPHPVSILLHFLKEPVDVSAVGRSSGTLPGGGADELRALFAASNATGSLSISTGTRPDCITVALYGTEMSVHVNLSNLTLVTRKNRQIPKKILRAVDNIEQALQLLSCTVVNGAKVAAGRMPFPDDVGMVVTRFYESIANDTRPPVTGEEGRRVLATSKRVLAQVAREDLQVGQNVA